MGTKRKTMKCECGGTFSEKVKEIQGVTCTVMVCGACDEIVFTLGQSKEFHKMKAIQDDLSKENKTIGRVGNSMGITLPIKLKELGFEIGKHFDIRLVDSNKLLIELRP